MARRSKGRSGAGFVLEHNSLTPGLESADGKLQAALFALANFWAPRVEGAARSGAKWTDQTSNARNGLTAVASQDSKVTRIDLFHTMPYGIWLEVRWSGRYAIIMPTIRETVPQIMSDARGILGRI